MSESKEPMQTESAKDVRSDNTMTDISATADLFPELKSDFLRIAELTSADARGSLINTNDPTDKTAEPIVFACYHAALPGPEEAAGLSEATARFKNVSILVWAEADESQASSVDLKLPKEVELQTADGKTWKEVVEYLLEKRRAEAMEEGKSGIPAKESVVDIRPALDGSPPISLIAIDVEIYDDAFNPVEKDLIVKWKAAPGRATEGIKSEGTGLLRSVTFTRLSEREHST